jgi:putative transposase
MPRPKGFRHPREIIAYAVWAYHRFALSTADVEDLLAERGVIVSRETIRLWVNRSARISPTVFVAIGQVPRTSGISTRW